MEPSLRVLLIDDEEIVHQTIGDYLRQTGHHVDEVLDGAEGLRRIEESEYDLALVDIRLSGLSGLSVLERAQVLRPDMAVVMISGHGTMDTVIDVLRNGATDYLKKPIKLRELDAIVEKAARYSAMRRRQRHMVETIEDLRSPVLHRGGAGRPLVGVSEDITRVVGEIRRAVEAECPTVLLTGETGTGKEVVAGEIHRQASGDRAPFIPVCCPALPETLVESELFGHVKGAFTGATGPKPGHFELADGGTLFLDEVADLPLSVQAKLLRVLETRRFRRVGGTSEVAVNVRVIAATNVQLEKAVEGGRFRRDLFYRLNVFHIHLTPLRERPEDIPALAAHFLALCLAKRALDIEGFTPEALDALRANPLPGNARQLRNIIERAVILCRTGHIDREHLSLPDAPEDQSPAPSAAEANDEAAQIRHALEHARWNRRRAAEILRMPYSTLRYKMAKLGIE